MRPAKDTFCVIADERRNVESERHVERMVVDSSDIGETKALEFSGVAVYEDKNEGEERK